MVNVGSVTTSFFSEAAGCGEVWARPVALSRRAATAAGNNERGGDRFMGIGS
jgi:hypothetical protein